MDLRRQRVLQRLRQGATLRMAAGDAGISRMTLHRWRQCDKEFARGVANAYETANRLREYYCWIRHPRRGLRPPTGKGHGGAPRFRA